MNQKSKTAPPKHPLMIIELVDRAEMINVLTQLVDQRKQFSVMTDEDTKGWTISYTSGPYRN